MTTADARAQAEQAIAHMQEMNASYEHVPSKDKASMAGMVIDLCSQLDAAHARIAALTAAPAPDAHVGAVGGE